LNPLLATLLADRTGWPSREIDRQIAEALGWRVDQDPWWNWCGQDDEGRPIIHPPEGDWCVRRDGRHDRPRNEALPRFTAMSAHDLVAALAAAGRTTETAP
jgi:hypothetical protein